MAAHRAGMMCAMSIVVAGCVQEGWYRVWVGVPLEDDEG